MSMKPLRFGLMCNSSVLQAWEAQCLEHLLTSDAAQLSLVIMRAPSKTPGGSRVARQMSDLTGVTFTAFRRLADRRARAKQWVDMTAALESIPRIQCCPILKGKFSQYFSLSDIAIIREHHLDFILRFGFNIIRGEILSAARYGVWSFHHDDEARYRGSPAAFWEIHNDDPVSGAILQRLTDKLDAGCILYKGYFPTITSSWSRNADQVLFGSAEWPAKVCRDIQRGAGSYLNNGPSKTTAPIYVRPSNTQTLRVIAKMITASVRRHLRDLLMREQWHVGILRVPAGALLRADTRPPIEWLPTLPRTRFIADPFGISDAGKLTILVEDFDQIRRKGDISAITSSDGGRTWSDPRRLSGGLFSSRFHKSYPYIIQHQGQVFCIPECWESNAIRLHRAVRFPLEWEQVAVLMEGVAGIDPTVFQHNGLWWMFYAVKDDTTCVKLHLAYAPSLTGPWHQHAGNPLKTDVRGARPGGTPFVHQGVLYRPGQDCTGTYGRALVVYRVTKLSPNDFEEEPICTLYPERKGPYPHAFHTLSVAGDLCLVDGKRVVAVPNLVLGSLILKLKSAAHRTKSLVQTIAGCDAKQRPHAPGL